MRKLRQTGNDVANRVKAWLIGFEIGIRMNESALDFRFRFFQADIFGERAAPDSN